MQSQLSYIMLNHWQNIHLFEFRVHHLHHLTPFFLFIFRNGQIIIAILKLMFIFFINVRNVRCTGRNILFFLTKGKNGETICLGSTIQMAAR